MSNLHFFGTLGNTTQPTRDLRILISRVLRERGHSHSPQMLCQRFLVYYVIALFVFLPLLAPIFSAHLGSGT